MFQNVQLRVGGRSLWPAAVAFHPADERLLAAVCTSTTCVLLPRDETTGTLLQYDHVSNEVVGVLHGEAVSSILLNYMCNGAKLVVATVSHTTPNAMRNIPRLRSVLVLDATSFVRLHRLPGLPTCTVRDVIPIYNARENRLALVMHRRRLTTQPVGVCVAKATGANHVTFQCQRPSSGPAKMAEARSSRSLLDLQERLQVAIYRVTRFDVSLRKLCHDVIIAMVTGDRLGSLPLPPRVICDLQGERRY